MTERKFKVGERVRWESSKGKAGGKVVRIATESGRVGDFVYGASKDDPRYIVETDDGKPAAHRPEILTSA